MSREKRKHRRLSATVMADICDGKTLQTIGKGAVFNISETGVALETRVELDKNDPFFLRLSVPIEVLAKIIRVEKAGNLFIYGVEFSKMKISEAIKLKKIALEKNK